MVEEEVESVLREIRERVRAQAPPPVPEYVPDSQQSLLDREDSTDAPPLASATDALARLELNLATAERTWNRLPPLVSNRHGWVARVELRIKLYLKRATHWYTWEQVNFNSAVKDALRETAAALAIHDQHLMKMREEINALRLLKIKFESYRAKLESRLAALEISQQESTTNAQERITQMLDEQRICFKQLSLETSEASIIFDRARRSTAARLDEMASQLQELRALKTELEQSRRTGRAS